MVTHPKGIKSPVHPFENWKIHPEDCFGHVSPTKSFLLPENLMSSYGQYGQFGTISLAKTCKKWPLPKMKIFHDKSKKS